MARSYYCHKWATGLTGGGNLDLDSNDYYDNQTQDGDIVTVFLSDRSLVFEWDSISTETEDGYSVIKPDSVSGAGRWILKDRIMDSGSFAVETLNYIRDIERSLAPVDCGEFNDYVEYIIDGGSF